MSFGGDLIEWLQIYTLKAEMRNIVPSYAKVSTKRFFDILGQFVTTSTLVLRVIFKGAINKFFKEANHRNLLHVIIGMLAMANCADSEYPVMIDLNLKGDRVCALLCNAMYCLDKDGTKSAAKFLEDSEQLIKQYYNKADQRTGYAIMPHFLLSSTPVMMEVCKEIRMKYPETKFHTHMSENLGILVYSVCEFSQKGDTYYGDDGVKPNPEVLKLLRTKQEDQV